MRKILLMKNIKIKKSLSWREGQEVL